MKNPVFSFALVFGLAEFVSSCTRTYKLTFDKNVPLDQTATVNLIGCFVKEVNGVNIKKDLYGTDEKNITISTDEKIILNIPAGDTEITFDVFCYLRIVGSVIIIKNIAIQYNFESGKEYQIEGIAKWVDRDTTNIFLELKDITAKRKVTLLKEWKLR